MRPASRSTRPLGALLLLLSWAAASRSAAAQTAPQVTAADVRARVGVLAHDSMGGRAVGTPGIAAASRYLVAEARRLGLRPAGDDGTYLQKVPLTRTRTTLTAAVTGGASPRTLAADELLYVSGLAGLPGTSRREGEAPLVYAGYLADPSVGAEELRPQQLAGAAVILRLGAAPGSDSQQPRLPLAMLFTPASTASAVLLVAEGENEQVWEYAATIARGGAMALDAESETGTGTGPAFFLVSPATAERLLGAPLPDARQPRTGLGTFRFAAREERSAAEAWNVVAMLPGRDPARAGQIVALGSHYDHVGVGEPVDGDSINNGADDDASGTAALLEIAERFASLPAPQRPDRSLLFVWHTAEEDGLLGSEHFTAHPTVPRDSIVTQLNIDMIGRNAPDSVFLVGSRRLSSALGELVEEANRMLARPFQLDYSYDVPGHPEQIYCRSDHYNYARFGIPVTFFTTGLHPDYHKPSDEAEKLDYDKLARVAGLVGDIALSVATRAERPRIDRPVPPPDAPCQ